MSNQSCIEHRANYHFFCFREDYLQIVLQCTYKKQAKKNHASAHCKAIILDIMEHWTNDKRSKGDGLWIFMSNQQWITAMYGMFKYNAIIDSLDELLGEGLIFRKPYKMFGRDSWQYLINAAEINKRMRALPDRNPHDLEPQVNLLENQRDKSKSYPHPLENQRDPLENQRDPLENQRDPLENQHNIDSYLDSNRDTNREEEEESESVSQPSFSSSSLSSFSQKEGNDTPDSSKHQENGPSLSKEASDAIKLFKERTGERVGVTPKLINNLNEVVEQHPNWTIEHFLECRQWLKQTSTGSRFSGRLPCLTEVAMNFNSWYNQTQKHNTSALDNFMAVHESQAMKDKRKRRLEEVAEKYKEEMASQPFA